MKTYTTLLNQLSISALLFGVLTSNHAQAESWLDDIAKDSEAKVNFRYRIETVDQDGIDEEALASTLRTRLNWQSGQFGNYKLELEFDDVSSIGDDDYNSVVNGNSIYPVVADPEGSDFNQAYLSYLGFSDSVVKVGRHRINHDDQRFIGGVAWRQNEQTYDGLSFNTKLTEQLTLDASYIVNVNRIFGPSGAGADREGDFIFLHANYAFNAANTVRAFYYSLDYEQFAAASTATFGLDYQYKRKLENDAKIMFNAQYMSQSDTGDNPTSFDADYYSINAKYAIGKFWALIGTEVLGADNGIGFATPLATLHKFNGFADKFLGTPGTGLEDTHLKLGAKFNGVKLMLALHDFAAETGSLDYGTEIDFVAKYPLTKKVLLLAKYASYSADNFATDTDKFWFMVNVNI